MRAMEFQVCRHGRESRWVVTLGNPLYGGNSLYGAYLEVIDGCSPAEKRQLMCDTAASVYTL